MAQTTLNCGSKLFLNGLEPFLDVSMKFVHPANETHHICQIDASVEKHVQRV